ncbi:uncharacterized protein LOC118744939 [Rhagoletis pomonella]|uniref:uncharacterized protein LOC118744939 n=1 Tax=Rhagoletis pomonella TaxID=28610 RepID=UPI001784FDEE|nr:uncharacterized protein LOC118744939 [Rhagoletis pomonella]
MGAKLTKGNTVTKKPPKRRVTLNAISRLHTQQQQQHQASSEATPPPPQSSQCEKVRTRNYDERMTVAHSEQTREQSLGDPKTLSATLTYTACPLKAISKPTTPPRHTQTQPTNNADSKSRNKLKSKVPSEPSLSGDAGTVMTDHDEEDVQRGEVRNNQSYEMLKMHSQQQQQQLKRYAPSSSPLTAPMQMLQRRQTTFDKLPNNTINVTTVETATTSSATTSHTKLDVNAIRSLTICRPKRKKLVRQSISSHAAPMKAIPLIKESIEIFTMPLKLPSNGGEQLKDNDSRILADDETEDEIKVIKAPPKLARDKSFVLRFV